MKKAKLAASLIAVSVAATTLLTGCNGDSTSGSGSSTPSGSSTGGGSDSGSGSGDSDSSTPTPTPAEDLEFKLEHAPGTTIRIAAGYNNKNTGITFDAEAVKDGVKLADGKTYHAGDLKPTWQAIKDKLQVNFENKYQGNSASSEFPYWRDGDKLSEVDIVAGSASALSESGATGKLVDLSKYLNDMPNFKKYLDENPIVRLSILGRDADAELGPIYFAPYFDGVNDIERMPLMRTDWVEKLLDGPSFTVDAADASKTIKAGIYTAWMPKSGTVDVEVVKEDGSAKETIKKNYDAAGGNVVDLLTDGMSAQDAVNALRTYIDKAYDGYYGDKRSNLFIGQNAAWDADELVALLRCVVANPHGLTGNDTVGGLFSRQDNNNQRRVDMFRFAGSLFGARGLESRSDYLYVGNDKKLHDARQETATYEALEKMNQMAQEGLIAVSYMNNENVSSERMVKEDLAFMSYDYNQTQTIFNEQTDKETGKKLMDEGEKYRAVMVPVSKWKTGSDDTVTYMRFTESWRSVKDSGWAIPVTTEENKDVLNACLHLFDYAFSQEGQILMSYGPDSFIDVKDANGKTIEEKYNTFDFNGTKMPKISEDTRKDLWDKEGGNYTNYARRYLGSTLHFLKSQAFEVQCTTEAGREGAGYISNAIKLGTIKHPELTTTVSNPWYISVPSVLPSTPEENTEIAGMVELSGGDNGQFNTGSDVDKNGGNKNVLCNMIIGGYNGENVPGKNASECVAKVSGDWDGTRYLEIKNLAWEDLLAIQ